MYIWKKIQSILVTPSLKCYGTHKLHDIICWLYEIIENSQKIHAVIVPFNENTYKANVHWYSAYWVSLLMGYILFTHI